MTDAAHKAFSFAACEAIRAGDWDEHLHLIAHEVTVRQQSLTYRAKVLAAAEIRAGQSDREGAHPFRRCGSPDEDCPPWDHCVECEQRADAPIHHTGGGRG